MARKGRVAIPRPRAFLRFVWIRTACLAEPGNVFFRVSSSMFGLVCSRAMTLLYQCPPPPRDIMLIIGSRGAPRIFSRGAEIFPNYNGQ